LLALAAVAALGAGVALPGAADAFAHFRAGRFTEAREALDQPAADLDEGRTLLLKAYLARRPGAALPALEGAVAALGPADPVGAAAAADAAAIRFAQGRHREVLTTLQPLLDRGAEAAPGRALVLAGLSRQALGDKEGAAGLLATVKPGDPEFAAARAALGNLALADKDPAKALRYYENADDETRTGAGRWRALRLAGRDDDAEQVRLRLAERDAGGLALLEISRVQRAAADEDAARLAQEAPPAGAQNPAAAATPADGRYTLQLGAFSDRGLALAMMRQFGAQVPSLRIDTERDARGQFLYKVRSGAYVSPARAKDAADALKRSLGVDVFVAELGG
ncbi:MAG: SPOR domain-containing protein, partial [Candidatus Krumholzibacteriia bacterium]